jgi:hypothetical protein
MLARSTILPTCRMLALGMAVGWLRDKETAGGQLCHKPRMKLRHAAARRLDGVYCHGHCHC